MSAPSRDIPRIFVSHSHEDAVWCHKFVERLRSCGVDVWYDEHNLGHGDLSDVIDHELRARSVFILILSTAALSAPWVRREMAAAVQMQDREPARVILPVLAAPAEIPLLWSQYKRVTGSDDTPLAPDEAAARVLHILRLPAIPPAHFPRRLATLGFTDHVIQGAEVILSPLCDVPTGTFVMGSDPWDARGARRSNGNFPDYVGYDIGFRSVFAT